MHRLANLGRLAVLGLICAVCAAPVVGVALWLGFGWAMVTAVVAGVLGYRLTPNSMEGGYAYALIMLGLIFGVVIAAALDLIARF